MAGWIPLSAVELIAWADLTGAIVRSEEWTIMRNMDAAFLSATADGKGTSAPMTDITVNAFDAVFG
tara:strand:- start:2205 stop:2402 length:198 start_codon:yes stop_codon:yes gene_type:complete